MVQKELTGQYEVKLHKQILKVCHSLELPLHNNHFGSKIYTNYQRVALMVLFVRSRKPLRQFVNELPESRWPQWLGLRELVSKSTLHRWLRQFDLSTVRQLLQATVAEERPSTMAIDATGIDSWKRSRHYERRLGEAPLPYAKADILVDTQSRLVHDFVLRMRPRHDVHGAASMSKRCKHKGVLLLGDKGYDSEPLHRTVEQTGNLLYAPVRDFRVKRPKGRHRRRCQQGHEVYGQRNIVEAVIRGLKTRIHSLRSKLHFMKKRELAWHIIVYNLEKLKELLQLFMEELRMGLYSPILGG